MAEPFEQENADYESWLRTQCDVVQSDLDHKHDRMTKSAFVFLRATYFRWARLMPELFPGLMDTPQVLAVGDIHLENYGTWRDQESRLVWGVNDFDEAAVMPYAFDLVRLVCSIRQAPHLSIDKAAAAELVLQGYGGGLSTPRPTLVDDRETAWMREDVAVTDEDRAKFWQEIDEKDPDATPPHDVAASLMQSLPADSSEIRFAARPQKGGGGLGRPRYIVVASWRGGRVVREAKALVPSAWSWARNAIPAQHPFEVLARGQYRAFDPFLTQAGAFIVRRIAADSRKINLKQNPDSQLKDRVLRAMGFDLGAIHAASASAVAAIQADLAAREQGWLHKSAKSAETAVHEDFAAWQQFHQGNETVTGPQGHS